MITASPEESRRLIEAARDVSILLEKRLGKGNYTEIAVTLAYALGAICGAYAIDLTKVWRTAVETRRQFWERTSKGNA